MKSPTPCFRCKLTISTIIFLVALISCEKEIVDDNEDDGPNISDTRPVLSIGSNSVTAFENDSETLNYENPFDAVSLHNPETLALVISNESSAKKAESVDPEERIYNLYEVAADTFELVKGEEGNDIFFKGITVVQKINDTWQLYVGDTGVELITNDLTINYVYEIQSDSIFTADTIPMAGVTGEPYENLGDTLFISADSTIYNDTLWIQLAYAYTDTIDIQTDTLGTEKSVIYKSLLLNTKDGTLYDLNSEISMSPQGYNFSHDFQYREQENLLYFRNQTKNQICKLDLTVLSLETFTLPYDIDIPWDTWSEVDNNFFFWSIQYPRAFCYVPGSGLITKSNIDFTSEFVSIGPRWTGKSNTYFWIHGVQGGITTPQGLYENIFAPSMFTLEMRNDSMIFSPVEIITDIDPQWFEMGFFSLVEFEINDGSDRWFFCPNERIAWKFDEETSEMDALVLHELDPDVVNNRITNGKDMFISLFNSTIYKLDISVPALEPFIVMSELDVTDFTIGPNQNIFAKGMRFSDLNDVTIEYDGITGAKVNEWIQENAPPESNISFLAPIF